MLGRNPQLRTYTGHVGRTEWYPTKPRRLSVLDAAVAAQPSVEDAGARQFSRIRQNSRPEARERAQLRLRTPRMRYQAYLILSVQHV